VTHRPDRHDARRSARTLSRVAQEQDLLREDADAATAWGREHPDVFGGLWFDNYEAKAGTGPVRLAVAVRAGAEPALTISLQSRLRRPDRLAVVPCTFSLLELNAARDQIREKHMPDRLSPDRGTHITTLSIDVQRNSIEVGLSQRDDDKAREFADEVAGYPVVFVHGVRIEPVARGRT
jgi:hypothetical protein